MGAGPGQRARIAVVLDQLTGALRWSGRGDASQVVGIDLLPAAQALLREAADRGFAVTLLLPDGEAATAAHAAELLAPLPVVTLDEHAQLGGAGAVTEPRVFVAADRVLRQAAADRGERPVPHPALALDAAGEARFLFVAVSGARSELSDLPGLVPYWLEHGADGTWRCFGVLSLSAFAHAVTKRLRLERLALDPGVEDPLLIQLDPTDDAARQELAERNVLWSDGRRVLLALDAFTRNDAIAIHGPHGHFLLLTPSPELLRPAPDHREAALVTRQALAQWIQERPSAQLAEVTLDIEPAGAPAVAAPPATAASFTADVERYSGARPLDAAGPVRSRHSSHPDNARVVQALLADLAAIGYAPYTHAFTFGGHPLHNVIADLPGAGFETVDPDPREEARGVFSAETEPPIGLGSWYPWWDADVPLPGFGAGLVVVGCHLDSTAARDAGYDPCSGPASGADDDGSGIAATLAIAREFWAYRGRLRHTVRFCFFNAEESGLIGSKAYASALKAADAPIKAVVCCDMIGYNSDAQRVFEVHAGFTDPAVRDASMPIAEVVAASAASLGALPPAQVYRGTIQVGGTDRALYDGAINRSDHAAFHQQGYPAVVVTEDFFPNDPAEPVADANPNYHRNADATIDGPYGADITCAVSLAVRELAGDAG